MLQLKKTIFVCVFHAATFHHPLGFCGGSSNNNFNLLASVSLNGSQLWSGNVPAALTDEAFCSFNRNSFSYLSFGGVHIN
jgi:hypothetical protein